jgi:hypothetical protein
MALIAVEYVGMIYIAVVVQLGGVLKAIKTDQLQAQHKLHLLYWFSSLQ